MGVYTTTRCGASVIFYNRLARDYFANRLTESTLNEKFGAGLEFVRLKIDNLDFFLI